MKKSLFLFLIIGLMSVAQAATYTMATINLGFGALDVPSGDGVLNISTDASNKITGLVINASVGLFGDDEEVSRKVTIDQLKNGEVLTFAAEEAAQPILKIQALPGFNENGGKALISIRQEDGFKHETVLVAKGKTSGKYFVWQNNEVISEIGVNVRGYSKAKMYVGWYELE